VKILTFPENKKKLDWPNPVVLPSSLRQSFKLTYYILGQERYRSLAPMYYRGAAAALVVYDITDPVPIDTDPIILFDPLHFALI